MSVRSGQSCTTTFATQSATGAAVNADSLPTASLIINGAVNGTAVTVTNQATGRYTAAFTLPTLSIGDLCELFSNATISSVAGGNVVWRERCDILLDSSGRVDAIKLGSNTFTFNGPYIGETQPVNFTGTGASALVKSDAIDWNSVAVTGMPMPTYTQPTGFLAVTFPAGTVANTTNITAGTITTVTTTTNLTNLPAIPANWLTAAGIAAGALNGKGDWLLSSSYTAPLSASGTRSALGMAAANLDTQLAAIDADVLTRLAASSYTAAPTVGQIDTQLSGTHGSGAWGGASGTGPDVVILTINDGTNALQNAAARLTLNLATHFDATTDVAGHCTFGVADGSYTVSLGLAGYTFAPVVLAVSGATTHTYSMTQVAIPPSNVGFTTGFLYCYDANFAIAPGVSFTRELTQLPSGGTGVSGTTGTQTVVSDGTGLVSFTNLLLGAEYYVQRAGKPGVRVSIPLTAGPSMALPDVLSTP